MPTNQVTIAPRAAQQIFLRAHEIAHARVNDIEHNIKLEGDIIIRAAQYNNSPRFLLSLDRLALFLHDSDLEEMGHKPVGVISIVSPGHFGYGDVMTEPKGITIQILATASVTYEALTDNGRTQVTDHVFEPTYHYFDGAIDGELVNCGENVYQVTGNIVLEFTAHEDEIIKRIEIGLDNFDVFLSTVRITDFPPEDPFAEPINPDVEIPEINDGPPIDIGTILTPILSTAAVMSFEAQALADPTVVPNGIQRTLQIRPIWVHGGGEPLNDRYWFIHTQLTEAIEVWKKAAITLIPTYKDVNDKFSVTNSWNNIVAEVIRPVEVLNGNLAKGLANNGIPFGNEDAWLDQLALQVSPPATAGVIDVFFVNFENAGNLYRSGGGVTFDARTAFAKIVISDRHYSGQTMDYLLAHELAHVVNGDHPGATRDDTEIHVKYGDGVIIPIWLGASADSAKITQAINALKEQLKNKFQSINTSVSNNTSASTIVIPAPPYTTTDTSASYLKKVYDNAKTEANWSPSVDISKVIMVVFTAGQPVANTDFITVAPLPVLTGATVQIFHYLSYFFNTNFIDASWPSAGPNDFYLYDKFVTPQGWTGQANSVLAPAKPDRPALGSGDVANVRDLQQINPAVRIAINETTGAIINANMYPDVNNLGIYIPKYYNDPGHEWFDNRHPYWVCDYIWSRPNKMLAADLIQFCKNFFTPPAPPYNQPNAGSSGTASNYMYVMVRVRNNVLLNGNRESGINPTDNMLVKVWVGMGVQPGNTTEVRWLGTGSYSSSNPNPNSGAMTMLQLGNNGEFPYFDTVSQTYSYIFQLEYKVPPTQARHCCVYAYTFVDGLGDKYAFNKDRDVVFMNALQVAGKVQTAENIMREIVKPGGGLFSGITPVKGFGSLVLEALSTNNQWGQRNMEVTGVLPPVPNNAAVVTPFQMQTVDVEPPPGRLVTTTGGVASTMVLPILPFQSGIELEGCVRALQKLLGIKRPPRSGNNPPPDSAIMTSSIPTAPMSVVAPEFTGEARELHLNIWFDDSSKTPHHIHIDRLDGNPAIEVDVSTTAQPVSLGKLESGEAVQFSVQVGVPSDAEIGHTFTIHIAPSIGDLEFDGYSYQMVVQTLEAFVQDALQNAIHALLEYQNQTNSVKAQALLKAHVDEAAALQNPDHVTFLNWLRSTENLFNDFAADLKEQEHGTILSTSTAFTNFVDLINGRVTINELLSAYNHVFKRLHSLSVNLAHK